MSKMNDRRNGRNSRMHKLVDMRRKLCCLASTTGPCESSKGEHEVALGLPCLNQAWKRLTQRDSYVIISGEVNCCFFLMWADQYVFVFIASELKGWPADGFNLLWIDELQEFFLLHEWMIANESSYSPAVGCLTW